MRKTAILLFLIVTFFPSVFASQEQDARVIDDYIARQARRERGEEYKDARKVIVGDLNQDANPETVVLYTIESQRGSNNYVQYLAVFVRQRGRLTPLTSTPVGGKTRRSVELTSVSNKVITLETLDYGPQDPSCCPTIKGSTEYVLVGRVLRERIKRKAP